MSQLFQAVKKSVTARQVAEYYGLKVNAIGMACCPFHRDRTPSMKVDNRYYCFGCGATGDSIDLAVKLLGIPCKDAANRLAADFDLNVDHPISRISPPNSRGSPGNELSEWINHAVEILLSYRSLLREYEKMYAPQSREDEWNLPFCEALGRKDYVNYLLDELMLCCKDRFREMKDRYGREIDQIERRLGEFTERNASGNCSGQKDIE